MSEGTILITAGLEVRHAHAGVQLDIPVTGLIDVSETRFLSDEALRTIIKARGLALSGEACST